MISGLIEILDKKKFGFWVKFLISKVVKKEYRGILEKGTKYGLEKSAPAARFLGTYFDHLIVKASVIRVMISIVDLVSILANLVHPQGRFASIFILLS